MNIHISNLSFNTKDDDLNSLFSKYGEVSSAKVIMDKATGRSRGFGFVEMSDDKASKSAIAELDGTTNDTRTIKVTEARPREERPASRNNSGDSYNNSGSYNQNHY